MTAVTVTVVAALDECDNVAVTVVEPPFSGIEEDASDNATVGAASSSVIVPVPSAAPSVAFVGPLSATFTVSSGSSMASPVTITETAPPVTPAAMVSVPAASAV